MPDALCDKLLEDEVFWRDRYHFLQEKGYTLRPRYHPEWQPSWKSKANPIPILHEDFIFLWKTALIDATSQGEGGKQVFIKRVDFRTHPDEFKIALRLGSPESQKDKGNYCVPVLNIFSDDWVPEYRYIVMPVLRPFNDPDFTSSGEVFDFVSQTLEGLVYMHAENVAHRDCAAENILMDGTNLYKDGWHPMNPWQARDGGDLFLTRKRSEAEIKYFFIDFGLSTEFAPGQRERLVTGLKGRIEAPEQSSEIPYDPFKYDVYCLGEVYQKKIVDQFKGLEMLGDLARLMTQSDPKDRPTAQETLKIWGSLRLLPTMPPRWTRLRTSHEEGPIERIMNNALDVVAMVRGSLLAQPAPT